MAELRVEAETERRRHHDTQQALADAREEHAAARADAEGLTHQLRAAEATATAVEGLGWDWDWPGLALPQAAKCARRQAKGPRLHLPTSTAHLSLLLPQARRAACGASWWWRRSRRPARGRKWTG